MKSPTMPTMKSPAIFNRAFLTFIALAIGSSLFAQTPPSLNRSYLGFRLYGADESFYRGFFAALLLTPEQVSALQAGWKAPDQAIGDLRKNPVQDRREQEQLINAKLREIVAITDGILTPGQADTRALLENISDTLNKEVDMEFNPKIDETIVPQEKSNLRAERLKVWKERVVEQVKASLPPDRLAAFLAAKDK